MESAAFDLNGLMIVLAVSTAISALGIALDKLLLPGRRVWISGWLAEWWLNIEDLKFPDIGRAMARRFLLVQQYIQGPRLFSLRFAITTLLISVSITTVSMIIGDSIYFKDINEAIVYLPNYQLHFLYPINLLFDTLTIIVTVLAVRVIITASWMIVPVVVVDAILAAIFSVTVWVIVDALEFPGDEPPVISISNLTLDVERLKEEFRVFVSYLDIIGILDLRELATLSERLGGWLDPWPLSGGAWGRVIYSASTLIPTLGYLTIILLLITSWAAFKLGRNFLQQLISLDVKTEKSIFFYSGLTFSIIAISTKLLIELEKL